MVLRVAFLMEEAETDCRLASFRVTFDVGTLGVEVVLLADFCVEAAANVAEAETAAVAGSGANEVPFIFPVLVVAAVDFSLKF